MDIEQLLAEAQRLARHCTLLVDQPNGGPIAAVWRDPDIAAPAYAAKEHRVTIDCRFLPPHLSGLTGCVSIYDDDEADDDICSVVDYDPNGALPEASDASTKLYAQPAMSLPPISAICQLGAPIIQDWLAANGWEQDAFDRFPDPDLTKAYNRIYQGQNPLYTNTAFAILGGWHFPWPDGDWNDLLNQDLIVWTLQDAEPWVEVWRDANGRWQAIERIT